MNKYWVAIKEATKEPLRILVLSIIPIAIAYFTELNYWWAAIAIVILRYIDKILHEIGKEKSTTKVESPLLTGLTRF